MFPSWLKVDAKNPAWSEVMGVIGFRFSHVGIHMSQRKGVISGIVLGDYSGGHCGGY